jgi:putative hemolysin
MNRATPTAPPPVYSEVPFTSRILSRDRLEGGLAVRLARTSEDIDAALQLRYEVFNLEFGEGLAAAFRTGRECDQFDSDSEHLIIVDRKLQRAVGTFRLRTYEIAKTAQGFYSSQQFDLSALPPEILANAIEISRVCITRAHRHNEAQMMLLNGLGMSLLQREKRYLFGSFSLSTTDPMLAGRIFDQLDREGHVHPRLRVAPKPGFKCMWYRGSDGPNGENVISGWIRTCLQFGAKVFGPPAINRRFRTIDLPFFLDGKQLDEIHR